MKLTIVVPCFNEARRLRQGPFEAWRQTHPQDSFLFVDDGSTDDTWTVLGALPGQRIQLPANQGKAEAVRAGMRAAINEGAEAIGVWDADLSAPLEEIDPMRARLLARPELALVMGARIRMLGTDVRRSDLRHYVGRGFATATSMALGMGVYDTQCGAKIWRVTPLLSQLLEAPFLEPWLYDVELLMRLKAQLPAGAAMPVEEVPLRIWHHEEGSKVAPSHLFRALAALIRLKRRYG